MVRLIQAASLLAILFSCPKLHPKAVLVGATSTTAASFEENHEQQVSLRGTSIPRQLGEGDSETKNKDGIIIPVPTKEKPTNVEALIKEKVTPTQGEAKDKPFLMPIEDVFSITGRGTVVTGRIERGVINTGDSVEIVGFEETKTTTVTGVEMFRKILDRGEAGDNVGILLRGIDKTDVQRGQVLAGPGSIMPYTKFKAETYILTKDEGGRHAPFFNNYRPQFYFRTTDVTGVVQLPEGVEMVMPGDNVELVVELGSPIAMEKGIRFAIREGGRTIGAGTVSEIIG